MNCLTEADRTACSGKCHDDAALAEVATEGDADAKRQSRTAFTLLAAIQRWPGRSVFIGHTVYCAGLVLLWWWWLLRPATGKTYRPLEMRRRLRIHCCGNGSVRTRVIKDNPTKKTTVRNFKLKTKAKNKNTLLAQRLKAPFGSRKCVFCCCC
jgi:hypothetical protein